MEDATEPAEAPVPPPVVAESTTPTSPDGEPKVDSEKRASASAAPRPSQQQATSPTTAETPPGETSPRASVKEGPRPSAAARESVKEAPRVSVKENTPVDAPRASVKEAPRPSATAKDTPRESVKEAPHASVKEAPAEVPRVSIKEAPRVSIKEAPRPSATAKESPRESVKEAPRASVKEATPDVARVSVKEAPRESLKDAPRQSTGTKETPRESIKGSPQESPRDSASRPPEPVEVNPRKESVVRLVPNIDRESAKQKLAAFKGSRMKVHSPLMNRASAPASIEDGTPNLSDLYPGDRPTIQVEPVKPPVEREDTSHLPPLPPGWEEYYNDEGDVSNKYITSFSTAIFLTFL